MKGKQGEEYSEWKKAGRCLFLGTQPHLCVDRGVFLAIHVQRQKKDKAYISCPVREICKVLLFLFRELLL